MKWDEEDVRRFGRRVAELVAGYYGSLESARISPAGDRDPRELFGGPLPEEGTDPFHLLEEIERDFLPNCFRLSSPNYFGLFNPTPTVIGVYADAIASLVNQNTGAWSHSPAGIAIEMTVVRWLCALVGYGGGAFGTLTSGGTLANYTGIKTALNERIPQVRQGGVAAAPGRPTFYVSTQAHYSIDRLADMIGVGLDGMVKIECDAAARIVPGALEERIRRDRESGRLPFAVVGIAGTTTSGAIDPLADLAGICRRHGLWFHVDAAWGGAARLSRRLSPLLDGIEQADSITLDPHKWFSVPFTAGAIVARDGAALRRTFEVASHYLTDKEFSDHEAENLYQFGVAGSRRLDALKVWLSLRQYGRRGYEEAIERQEALARYLAERVDTADDMTAMTPPSLGVFCFRHLPGPLREPGTTEEAIARFHMDVQTALERRGRSWISTSVVGGRRVFRFCATSHLSRERHIDRLLEEVRAAGRELPVRR